LQYAVNPSMEAWQQLSLLLTPAKYTIISCTFYGHLGKE